VEVPKNTIRNPLTIIAIFAGIAEISGTTVLALLPADTQRVFLWFVMVFPVLVSVLRHFVVQASCALCAV
jgi:hypothetical protein